MTNRKTVFLHKRKRGLSVEEFHQQLLRRADADPLVAGLTSYVQSHSLLQGYKKGELLFDAVEEFSFGCADQSNDFLSRVASSFVANRMDIVGDVNVMTVDVHRIKDRLVPRSAVKNIEFVNRRLSVELAAFRRHWIDVHGPLASTIPSILRYEQNHIILESYSEKNQPRYDGLAMTWFKSTAAMREGAETDAYAKTRADEANFLPDGHLPIIIVKEVADR